MKYAVYITPQAEEQLRDIIAYIADDLQSPTAALSTLNTVEEAMNSLDLFPNRIPTIDEEPWRQRGIHKMTVKNFLVYFIIDEETQTVHVIAVIYGKREQKEQLTKACIFLSY